MPQYKLQLWSDLKNVPFNERAGRVAQSAELLQMFGGSENTDLSDAGLDVKITTAKNQILSMNELTGKGAAGAAKIGAIDPNKYTLESMQAYSVSGDLNDLRVMPVTEKPKGDDWDSYAPVVGDDGITRIAWVNKTTGEQKFVIAEDVPIQQTLEERVQAEEKKKQEDEENMMQKIKQKEEEIVKMKKEEAERKAKQQCQEEEKRKKIIQEEEEKKKKSLYTVS